MLSVIVAGRNDGHGYNLPRRVALSLNCLAHTLGDDDEIIFVDWNTPDALPTQAEAIADTLSERARRLIRVLRVRSSIHAVFAPRTPLPLLDSVARNVALRRANPANHWILSTTTDMVLVSRQPGARLPDIVAGLADGLYHLPRFDVPEFIWESLDRRDPARAIAACGHWGHAFHLDEVIRADPAVLFDGPGDFQLFPRAAVMAINGFDETMLLTYHTDSDLVRRLRPILGGPRSLKDHLRAYHCHHYRIGSIHHGDTRVENPPVRHDIPAHPPTPATDWGLPRAPVEELRLTTPPALVAIAALSRVLPPRTTPPPERAITADSRDDTRLDPHHVLPFLVDALITLPLGADVVASVAGPEMLSLLAAFWREAGLSGRLMVTPDTMARLGGRLSGVTGVGVAPADPMSLGPDTCFLFDPTPSAAIDAPAIDTPAIAPAATIDAGWAPDASAAAWAVTTAFRQTVAMERARIETGARARAIIVINAVHTVFETMVNENLSLSNAPFIGRVRRGVVRPVNAPPSTDLASLAGWLTRRLERFQPVPHDEAMSAKTTLIRLAAGERDIQITPATLAALDAPGMARACGIPDARWPEVRDRARAARMAPRLTPFLATPVVADTARRDVTPALSKLCDLADWEHPAWWRWLSALDMARVTANVHHRHRAAWEDAHITHILAETGLITPGDHTDRPARAALIVEPIPRPLHARLADLVGAVVVTPPPWAPSSEHSGEPSPAIWRGIPHDPTRLTYTPVTSPAPVFDAVILPRHVATLDGAHALAASLAWADARTREGGIIVFSADLALAGQVTPPWLEAGALAAAGGLETLVAAETGLTAAGPVDWSISEGTLEMSARHGTPAMTAPHLLLWGPAVAHTTALWTWRKDRPTSPDDWRRLAARLAQAQPIDMLARGAITGASRRGGQRETGEATVWLGAGASLEITLGLPAPGDHLLAVTARADVPTFTDGASIRRPAMVIMVETSRGRVLTWRAFDPDALGGAQPPEAITPVAITEKDRGEGWLTARVLVPDDQRLGVTLTGARWVGSPTISPPTIPG